jgi:hypothetical protein
MNLSENISKYNFSYILFAHWQQEAIAAIKTRRNQQTLQPLEEVV